MKNKATTISVWWRVSRHGLWLLVLLAQSGGAAQGLQDKVALRAYDFSYQQYSQLLKNRVQEGLVDYAGIKQNQVRLDSLVTALGWADLTKASRDERLAFYCNAYNILTIRSIVDVYPVSSIKEIDGVWDQQSWMIAGEKLTLNEIEHQVLRREFQEPRIHVAVNCASIGCPPLLEVPYSAERLDSLLSVSAKRFAASEVHNRIDSENKVAYLSAVFDWFGDDFINQYYELGKFPGLDKKKAAALNFIVVHLPEGMAAAVSGADYAVEYLEYDWALNGLNKQ